VGGVMLPTGHKISPVGYCDFKSQFPLVNGLLRNQDLMLAETIEARLYPPATQEFLEGLTIAELLKRSGLRSKASGASVRLEVRPALLP
jgi:hypothetical protein